MRVLHVLYNYVPDKTGSTTRSRGLLAGQKANGIEVFVVTSPFQGGITTDCGDELVDGITVYRTRGDGRLTIDERYRGVLYRVRKMFTILKFARDVRLLVGRHSIDIVHAHSTLYCFLGAKLAVLGLRVPVMYEVRSLWFERSKEVGMAARISAWAISIVERWCTVVANHVYVINIGLRDYLIERGLSPSRVTVVPNAVSEEVLLAGCNIRPRGANEPIVFGYAGNLSAMEGLKELVQAFVEEFAPDENVRLLIWGRGPYLAQLSKDVAEASDSRIEIRGEFSQSELQTVYGTIDSVVLPRRRSVLTETVTPLKPLEALAFGKKLLLSAVGGHREVVDGLAGIGWFQPDDIQSLRRALRLTVGTASSWRTESFATEMKDYVRKRKAWASVANRYRRSYEEAICD